MAGKTERECVYHWAYLLTILQCVDQCQVQWQHHNCSTACTCVAYWNKIYRYCCLPSGRASSLLKNCFSNLQRCLPSVLWRCWLGDRKGIRPVKRSVLICRWWWFDWSFVRLIAPVVTTTSIALSSNKIKSGDVLVSANPGLPGKRPLKRREKENSGDVLGHL